MTLATLLMPLHAAGNAQAATTEVSASDNLFLPKEIHIDPGDTVLWRNSGFRTHSVKSDRGLFNSGELPPRETFSRTFAKEGYFFYHCTFHGSARTGMWGLVVVGDPQPLGETRPRIVVPDDFPTIQRAVNRANPGSTVVIRPGTYREDVVVSTPDLVIRGVDRFRTVVRGADRLQIGFTIDGVRDVTIRNMTVRNFLHAGVSVTDAETYTIEDVDVIKNRTYGVYASRSFDGVLRGSFGWGSGDSAFRVGDCTSCSTIVDDVVASHNFMGLSTVNATGVVVRDSTFVRNGIGMVAMSLGDTSAALSRGVDISNNLVRRNDYSTVPAAGLAESYGLPFGTGIWIAGIANALVRDNEMRAHARYGVLVTSSFDGNTLPVDNEVRANQVRGSGGLDLAWDGSGADDCFSGNDIQGPTGPPDIQSVYACSARPFTGARYDPVADDVAAALTTIARDQQEPPEPSRPDCQRGRPGCHR